MVLDEFTTKYVIAIILVLNFISYGESSVKIWAPDNDVHNPSNWVSGKAQAHCDGLNLSESYHTVMALDNMSVKKIIFPLYGRVSLTEAVIEFSEHSKDIINCARIKKLIGLNYWLNPNFWIIEGVDENVAIPHYERVPCKYDDVIFPKGFKSGRCQLWDEVEIKTLKFGDKYLKDEDLESDINLEQLVFSSPSHDMIHISGKACTDPTGCVCSHDTGFGVHLCMDVNDTTYFNCLDPIQPIGFCTNMCLASILLKPKSNFQIAHVRKSLKHYSSDTYVSKVNNGSEEVIQIIFAEKKFTGLCLDEAKDYLSHLLADQTIESESIELLSSGPYFIEGKVESNTLSIVFGSLCGVVLFFAVLFSIYSPRFSMLNLGNRLLSPRPLSTNNLIARYDNIEDSELILERHSSAESIMNLGKSLDNPKFGNPTPSTVGTRYGTISTSHDKVTRTEISLENPMYEINNSDKSVQKVTEDEPDI